VLQGCDDSCPGLRGGLPRLRYQGGSMIRVRSLADGIESLREWFNDQSACARIVAVQSPT
jgi:hypothetical protein